LRFSENRDVMFASLCGSPRTEIDRKRSFPVLRELVKQADIDAGKGPKRALTTAEREELGASR
jgi:hypothetical protein